MSMFTLYLIMMLDSIGITLTLASILAGLLCFVCTMFYFSIDIAGYYGVNLENKLAQRDKAGKAAKRLGILFCVVSAINTFIPSTKDAAIIVVVPAIVNNEKLQAEASELYGMAKQALKDKLTTTVTTTEENTHE